MRKQTLPVPFEQFVRRFPKAHDAYERLGNACHTSGPLDAKTRELVQLRIAIGIRSEGANLSHVKKALEAGASPAEIPRAVLLGIPTLGLPTTVPAFTRVGDVLEGKSRSRRKK